MTQTTFVFNSTWVGNVKQNIGLICSRLNVGLFLIYCMYVCMHNNIYYGIYSIL